MFSRIAKVVIVASAFGLLAPSFTIPAAAVAGSVAIVQAEADLSLTPEQIKKLYLGKPVELPGKQHITLILTEDNETKTDFLRQVVHKTPAQVRAYWAKQIFTGKGHPPAETSSAELLKQIEGDPTLIGIISPDQIGNHNVRVLINF